MTIKSTGYALNPFTGKAEWVGRLRRPPYYRDSDNSLLVHVDGSDVKLLHFLIGNRVYIVNEGLTCNFATTGAGGLDRGDVAANTPYYLYAVVSSGSIKLIASVVAPNDGGPQGYELWTYIGACATDDGSATFYEFTATNGFFLTRTTLDTVSESATAGSYVEHTLNSLPITTRSIYGALIAKPNASGAGRSVYVAGNGANSSLTQNSQVASEYCHITGWVNLITAKTIYLYLENTNCSAEFILLGWQEDPTEYM